MPDLASALAPPVELLNFACHAPGRKRASARQRPRRCLTETQRGQEDERNRHAAEQSEKHPRKCAHRIDLAPGGTDEVAFAPA